MAFTGFINLTTGEVDIHETNLELQRLYLGGRGLGAALLYQRVDPTINRLTKRTASSLRSGRSMARPRRLRLARM